MRAALHDTLYLMDDLVDKLLLIRISQSFQQIKPPVLRGGAGGTRDLVTDGLDDDDDYEFVDAGDRHRRRSVTSLVDERLDPNFHDEQPSSTHAWMQEDKSISTLVARDKNSSFKRVEQENEDHSFEVVEFDDETDPLLSEFRPPHDGSGPARYTRDAQQLHQNPFENPNYELPESSNDERVSVVQDAPRPWFRSWFPRRCILYRVSQNGEAIIDNSYIYKREHEDIDRVFDFRAKWDKNTLIAPSRPLNVARRHRQLHARYHEVIDRINGWFTRLNNARRPRGSYNKLSRPRLRGGADAQVDPVDDFTDVRDWFLEGEREAQEERDRQERERLRKEARTNLRSCLRVGKDILRKLGDCCGSCSDEPSLSFR